MRELKFRVWDESDGRMKPVLSLSEKCCDVPLPRFPYTETIHGFKIMQFTGLQDKNAKDIYEGDILKIDNWSCFFKVVWDNWYAKFIVKKIQTGAGRKMDYIPVKESEVIGNIYENPELL